MNRLFFVVIINLFFFNNIYAEERNLALDNLFNELKIDIHDIKNKILSNLNILTSVTGKNLNIFFFK